MQSMIGNVNRESLADGLGLRNVNLQCKVPYTDWPWFLVCLGWNSIVWQFSLYGGIRFEDSAIGGFLVPVNTSFMFLLP